jgi:hypothetical protein
VLAPSVTAATAVPKDRGWRPCDLKLAFRERSAVSGLKVEGVLACDLAGRALGVSVVVWAWWGDPVWGWGELVRSEELRVRRL